MKRTAAAVAITILIAIGGYFGWRKYSAYQTQKSNAEAQRAEAEREQAEEAAKRQTMQPQVDWVNANLNGHVWGKLVKAYDKEDGKVSYDDERDEVKAGMDNTCSLQISVRHSRPAFVSNTLACQINLSGFPDSGISIEKEQPEDNQLLLEDGPPDWAVELKDDSRVSCSLALDGSTMPSTDSYTTVEIRFDNEDAAKRMASSFSQMVHQSCR